MRQALFILSFLSQMTGPPRHCIMSSTIFCQRSCRPMCVYSAPSPRLPLSQAPHLRLGATYTSCKLGLFVDGTSVVMVQRGCDIFSASVSWLVGPTPSVLPYRRPDAVDAAFRRLEVKKTRQSTRLNSNAARGPIAPHPHDRRPCPTTALISTATTSRSICRQKPSRCWTVLHHLRRRPSRRHRLRRHRLRHHASPRTSRLDCLRVRLGTRARRWWSCSSST